MNPQRISFARTLPILALLLSYVIIAIPATRAYFYFSRASQHGSDVLVPYHGSYIRVPHEHFLRTSIQGSAELTEPAVEVINLSGGFVNFVVLNAARRPRGWSLFGLSVPAWKAIAFPMFCLPFWWLAGVGLDALFLQRQLRWWALLPGSLFWAFFLFIVGALLFNVLVARGHYPIAMECGFSLWFVLLSAFPATLVKRWLRGRRIQAKLHARLSAELQ